MGPRYKMGLDLSLVVAASHACRRPQSSRKEKEEGHMCKYHFKIKRWSFFLFFPLQINDKYQQVPLQLPTRNTVNASGIGIGIGAKTMLKHCIFFSPWLWQVVHNLQSCMVCLIIVEGTWYYDNTIRYSKLNNSWHMRILLP